VTVTFFIHATEDQERLLSKIKIALDIPEEQLVIENIQGHFGNVITSVKGHFIGEDARKLSLKIFENLAADSRNTLISELEKSMDEHDSLYLRIDRQSLDQGLSLSDEEPIRIKLKPRIRAGGREAMIKQYAELIR